MGAYQYYLDEEIPHPGLSVVLERENPYRLSPTLLCLWYPADIQRNASGEPWRSLEMPGGPEETGGYKDRYRTSQIEIVTPVQTKLLAIGND